MYGTRRFYERLGESSSLRMSDFFIFPPLLILIRAKQINDLRRLFYETALAVDAEIRLGSTVETVDTAAGTITLSDGTILQGDVILGCDGLHGVTRQILMEANEEEEGAPTIDLSMYRYVSSFSYRSRVHAFPPGSVTVPKPLILNDPLLEHVYETDTVRTKVDFV